MVSHLLFTIHRSPFSDEGAQLPIDRHIAQKGGAQGGIADLVGLFLDECPGLVEDSLSARVVVGDQDLMGHQQQCLWALLGCKRGAGKLRQHGF